MSELKLATASDFPEVKRMVKSMFPHSPMREFSFDDRKVDAVINQFLQGPLNERIILLLLDPEPVGVMFLFKTESPFSFEQIAGELMWWIDEPYRNYKNAKKMIEAYKYWAKQIGAVVQQLGAMDAAHEKLYKRLGFSLIEYAYKRKVT